MKAAGRNRRCLHDAFVALKAKAAGRQREGIADAFKMPSRCLRCIEGQGILKASAIPSRCLLAARICLKVYPGTTTYIRTYGLTRNYEALLLEGGGLKKLMNYSYWMKGKYTEYTSPSLFYSPFVLCLFVFSSFGNDVQLYVTKLNLSIIVISNYLLQGL